MRTKSIRNSPRYSNKGMPNGGNSFYEVLGVSEDATETEIKKAYRGMSLKHHPDRGGNQAVFQEVSQAYETLSDPHKRQQYDMEQKGVGMGGVGIHELFQNLFHGQGGMGMGPGIHIFTAGPGMGSNPFGQNPFESDGIPFGFGPFAQFMKPQTIQIEVALELDQVLSGCVFPIRFERFVVRPQDNFRYSEERKMDITIPEGVEDGEIMMIPDVGNQIGASVGDVRVVIQLVPHPVFQREGLNLVFNKQLTLKEALCGFSFVLTLLSGRTLTIKNMSTPIRVIFPGMEQVCAGYGIKKGGQTGALIIRFQVVFPGSLEEEVRKQLMDLLP